MKNYKYIVVTLLSLFIFACSSDEYLQSLNIDSKNPSVGVPDELFFTNAEKALMDKMSSININTSIFRFITQYTSSPIYTQESQYNFRTRTISGNHWRILYSDVLTDLRAAKSELLNSGNYVAPSELRIQKNRLAMVEVLEVYTFAVLVDTFGDIPFSEALDISNVLPKYDDAATVHTELMSMVNHAISQFDTGAAGFGEADLIYGGDIDSWIKFANSLKLRLAMTVGNASAAAEAAPNVFSSNADNATLDYLSTSANANPLWNAIVESGRNDYIMANTIVDAMNSLEDPRRDVFFSNPIDGAYVGGPYGAGGDFDTFSHFGEVFKQPTLPGNLLDYAEVSFMLAEAVERGYSIGGTAEEHYNNAIMASMEYWGVDETDAAAYLSRPDVAYSTAAGSYNEKIGTQMWIALFNRGFESWLHWRRYDYPILNAAPTLTVDDIPVRMQYPIDEQQRNPENRTAAASAIGGDELTTKLFWDN